MKTTQSFHNDIRPTVVLIDNKVYDLQPSNLTFQYIASLPPLERPHVRYLNPIPLRTKLEQKEYNDQATVFHGSGPEVIIPTSTRVIKVNIKEGLVNPEIEIKKLEGLKTKAQKEGNIPEAKRLRRLLRDLGAKRYSQKTTKEA